MSGSSMIDITLAEQRVAERIDPHVTSELAVSSTGTGVSFSNVGEMMEFAKMMSVASGGVRKHLRANPGACLAILTQALEWGLSPFAVANKSYFVNDQIAFESQLIQAVILKRAPIKGRIKFRFEGEGDNRICFASATLKDGTGDVEYESPKFSKIQPKNSPLWKNDPDQQHCYYSGRALCRRHFPDVLLGIYDLDEVPTAIGPDAARDVTPPKKGISARLDAIAGSPAGATKAPRSTVHDLDTGEIEEQSAAADSEAPANGPMGASREAGAATDQEQPDEAGAGKGLPASATDDSAKAALLRKLKLRAQKGTSALRRALGGISQIEDEMLTEQDRDTLGDIAMAVDDNEAVY
ncbi:MAG: hypothetical protein P4M05_28025 [Bradyrhizobium sp.]|nr:hypothetical protein [Bradyrhizobium sp.]